ncbi:hypothetical protein GCM10009647_026350 [Streptomyces sanglieri]
MAVPCVGGPSPIHACWIRAVHCANAAGEDGVAKRSCLIRVPRAEPWGQEQQPVWAMGRPAQDTL